MSHKYLYDDSKPSHSDDVGVKRNAFDISKRHHSTYNVGKLYPFYSRILQPNEIWHGTPTIKLDVDAMAHEIRNRFTAHVKFVAVPFHTIWSDYEKFIQTNDITQTSQYVMPYLDRAGENVCPVGGLLNHLGMPATARAKESVWTELQIAPSTKSHHDLVDKSSNGQVDIYSYLKRGLFNLAEGANYCNGSSNATHSTLQPIWCHQIYDKYGSASNSINALCSLKGTLGNLLKYGSRNATEVRQNVSLHSSRSILWLGASHLPHKLVKTEPGVANFRVSRSANGVASTSSAVSIMAYCGSDIFTARYIGGCIAARLSNKSQQHIVYYNGAQISINEDTYSHHLPDDFVDLINDHFESGNIYLVGHFNSPVPAGSSNIRPYLSMVAPLTPCHYNFKDGGAQITNAPGVMSYQVLSDATTANYDSSRFNGSVPALRINMFRTRAYRAAYNTFFRDHVRDPFCPAVNPHDSSTSTTPYLDRVVENMDSGADTDTPLDLEHVYWSEDYYSGALPSPSMMNHKPLVGVRKIGGGDLGTLTYVDQQSGDSSTVVVSLDGNVITGITGTSGDPDKLTLDTLQDAISVGISWDDIKLSQSLAKWYETNYKHGRYSVQQFLGAHYGAYPKGLADMFPQDLGSYDVPVTEWEVLNQTASEDQPLGARGAVATFGDKLKSFSYKSDEHTVILGLIWFTVDNNMSCALNKTWYVQDRPEIPDPLFANVGSIAIRQKEVAPLLTTDPEAVWAYQRQYGYMIEEHDTLAGDYCTDLSNEIMQRTFDRMPELDHEFLTINPDNLTNIFMSDANTDHIKGQIYMDCKLDTWLAQRPNVMIV